MKHLIIFFIILVVLMGCGTPTSNNEMNDDVKVRKFALRMADTLKTGDGPNDWTYPYSYFVFVGGDTIGSVEGISRRYFLELSFENGKMELAKDKKYIKNISVQNTEIAAAETKIMKMRYGSNHLVILIHGKKIGITKVEIDFSFGKYSFPLVIHPNVTGKWLRYPGGDEVHIWQIAALNKISQRINNDRYPNENWIFCDPNPSKRFSLFYKREGVSYEIFLNNSGEIIERGIRTNGSFERNFVYKRY